MKKIIFALVALMLTAPAWGAEGEVTITCEQAGAEDPNVIIKYNNTMDVDVRGFALNIVVDSGNITEVECLSPDFGYFIYPGSIDIEGGVEPTGEGLGTCVCDDENYDDTLPGPPDSNGVTIEMASLWSPNDPDHNEAPNDVGDLVRIKLSGNACITVTQNVIRAGVVMANPTSLLDTPADFCSPGLCVTDIPCYFGMADFAEWDSVGRPDCWCYPRQCHGDADGKQTTGMPPYYWVALPDLTILKNAYKQSVLTGDDICADFDHKQTTGMPPYYRVSLADLAILKTFYKQTGLPDPNCLPGNLTPP